MNNEETNIKNLLYDGFSVHYRDISIVDLRTTTYVYHMNKPYQVHSDKYRFSEVYGSLTEALEQFMDLKRGDRPKRKE